MLSNGTFGCRRPGAKVVSAVGTVTSACSPERLPLAKPSRHSSNMAGKRIAFLGGAVPGRCPYDHETVQRFCFFCEPYMWRDDRPDGNCTLSDIGHQKCRSGMLSLWPRSRRKGSTAITLRPRWCAMWREVYTVYRELSPAARKKTRTATSEIPCRGSSDTNASCQPKDTYGIYPTGIGVPGAARLVTGVRRVRLPHLIARKGVSCDLYFSQKGTNSNLFLIVEYFYGWYLVPKGVNGNPPEIGSIPLPRALRGKPPNKRVGHTLSQKRAQQTI